MPWPMLYAPCKQNHSIDEAHYANHIDHYTECVCAVRQYPWQTKDGFILYKEPTPNSHC